MKLVLIAIAGTLAFVYTNDITVPYYYCGNKVQEIHTGLNKWNAAGIYFRRVTNNFSLCVRHEEIDSDTGGLYQNKEIFVNTKYKFTNKDLTSLVGHEAGHFIGLSHSDEQASIMRLGYPYIENPNDSDVFKAFLLKPLIFLKKHI